MPNIRENKSTEKNDFIINVHNLTKDYGSNRGIFGVNLQVKKGEVYGYLGPNGAGKTTTIRHIMGFQHPQNPKDVSINSKRIWNNQINVLTDVGYLPGELAFPENLTGDAFVKFIGKLRKLHDFSYAHHLAKLFALNTSKKIKYMALGEKRKLAIVVAFMHNPSVLVLDEPTSGLDPLMQEVFIKYIKSQKDLGKTVLLSSHIYSEVEALCDRLSIIKEGRIISTCDLKEIKIQNEKKYKIEFTTIGDYHKFIKHNFNFIKKEPSKLQVRVEVNDKKINEFLKTLSGYKTKYLAEDIYTLEDHFMHFYAKK